MFTIYLGWNGQGYSFAGARLSGMRSQETRTEISVGVVGFGSCSETHAEDLHFVGKHPRSKAGNTALLVCVDAFSKFVCLIPIRETTTKATIKALKENIFCSFSVREVLVSDNSQCFTAQVFCNFCFGLV